MGAIDERVMGASWLGDKRDARGRHAARAQNFELLRVART